MEVSIPETHKSAYRHPKYKTSYRVKNWPEAEGFLKSILKLMDLYLPCPDHTTMSRRNRTANVRRYTRSLPDG